ncbi:MAG: pyridoxamine 5'-phosphate oxidase family protein [Clostridia bacterium]|nr:pyridoxamine 5'-phosphate oxidase family protein [Clostridia bacterium]
MTLSTVCDFLRDAGTYYLATVDGDQARVRPFGTILLYDGKLCIQTGKKKDVAKQIDRNPKVELCACKDGKWLRIAGEMRELDDRDARVAMLDRYPELKAMYDPDDGNTAVYCFTRATATLSSFTAPPETLAF